MTTTETYQEIGRLEEMLAREEKTLREREAFLREQILGGDNFTTHGDRATALAGVLVLKQLWPEREKLTRAKIFYLKNQVEAQRNK